MNADPTQRINEMARQMGRPCARGYMHPSHAIAAITAAAVRLSRQPPPRFSLHAVIATACSHLKASARDFAIKMDATRREIRDDAMDRLERGDTARAIRASAHDINGANGFPLAEHQVEQQVRAAAEAISRRREESQDAT